MPIKYMVQILYPDAPDEVMNYPDNFTPVIPALNEGIFVGDKLYTINAIHHRFHFLEGTIDSGMVHYIVINTEFTSQDERYRVPAL